MIEIIKSCADHMKIKVVQNNIMDNANDRRWRIQNPNGTDTIYDPITNDTQMVALIKKFRPKIDREPTGPYAKWFVYFDYDHQSADYDLNLAVCMAVSSLPIAT